MTQTLSQRFGVLICDLDGVVYRGPTAVDFAVAALQEAAITVHYATNNASRLPVEVAAHLSSLGIPTDATQVTTSSQAGAAEIARRVDPGSRVLAVGGQGVSAALEACGFAVCRAASADVAAVLQGYGPDVRAADLAEAAYAIEGGALWMATNTDLTLPTDRGIAPGNGALVGAVERAVGRAPDAVAGKPHPPLYRLCLTRLGAGTDDVLAIGDRLDTDIEGANAVGIPSLLVLTGVTSLRDALLALPQLRPTWVVPDLRWLTRPLDDPVLVQVKAVLEEGWAVVDRGLADPDWVGRTVARLHAVVDAGATVG